MSSGLQRLMRRAPPRLGTPTRSRDVRGPLSVADDVPVSALSAPETVSEVLRILDSGRSTHSGIESALVPIDGADSLPCLISRSSELLSDMDHVLIARLVCSLARSSTPVPPTTSEPILSRLSAEIPRLPLQALTRILFAFSTSPLLAPFPDMATSIYTSSSSRILQLVSSHESLPPRILAKLCIGFSRSSPSDPIWPLLQKFTVQSQSCLDAEHLQQISYSLHRVGIQNPSLITALIVRANTLSPISPIATYMSLTVSLSRLVSPENEAEWKLHKKIAMDHIGLSPVSCGVVNVGVFRKLLKNRFNHEFGEIQLKRIRTSFSL